MHQNVSNIERAVSAGVGSLLTGLALSRRKDWLDLAAGAAGIALIARGVTGWCSMYSMLGFKSVRTDLGRPSSPGRRGTSGGIKVEKSIDIDVPADRLYGFWRNLENLPKFMSNIRQVHRLGDRRSHWKVAGPLGETYEYDADIIRDEPGHMISWESLPGAEVNNAGTVLFEPVGDHTHLRVILNYNPPAGRVGDAAARMIGNDPEAKLGEDLRRLKEQMEGAAVS